LFEPFAQAVGVVSFVGQQPLWSGDGGKERNATFPGVSAKAAGLPRSSAKARILFVLPPRERPIASANSPFLNRSPSDAP
jgi:hypothetical protein